MKRLGFLFFSLVFSNALMSEIVQVQALYLDTKQPIDLRVNDLISRLTLEEKARLLNHKAEPVERFHILADQWNQCLNGVQWDRPTTFFPTCIAMAATWDTDLVQNQIATVLSDEARAIYNGWHLDPHAAGQHKGLIYRAPVINIERNPYWGRNHEAWGEDPFLTGSMAVSYVKGLQGSDPLHLKLAATLKHFAVNNVESDRQKLNAAVSERMLNEYWLPHFKAAIVEGGAQSVMASYNAINGVPNNINHWLLTDVLKTTWKHEGFVVSDLGGVRSMVEGHEAKKMSYVDAVAQSLLAGCDFSDKEYEKYIPIAVREGKLPIERVNDALKRVLTVRFKLGDFDPFEQGIYSHIPLSVISSDSHRLVALKAAQESIVLLQNRHAVLPLDIKTVKTIAVIGPLANRIIMNNYNGVALPSVTVLQGIKDRAPGVSVLYAFGGNLGGGKRAHFKNEIDEPVGDSKSELSKALAIASQADVAIVCVGTTAAVEQEARDRTTLALTGDQEMLVESVNKVNPKTIVVEMSAGPLVVPWIKTHVDGILQAWWPGEEGGHALADILFGLINPSGHLPHTVYSSEAQVPSVKEYDISKGFTYMYLKGIPLFAFGHGLSYTSFQYSDSVVSSVHLGSEPISITTHVRNTGQRIGDEVVQLYVRHGTVSAGAPLRELRGFKRVKLQSGATIPVTFKLSREDLARWDDATHGFMTRAGEYSVEIGRSSDDIRQTIHIFVD
jgi:beta-glucosidase